MKSQQFIIFSGVIDDPGTVHFLCQGKKMNFFEIAIWLHIILLALHCLWLEPFGSLLAFWREDLVFQYSGPLKHAAAPWNFCLSANKSINDSAAWQCWPAALRFLLLVEIFVEGLKFGHAVLHLCAGTPKGNQMVWTLVQW